MTTKELYDGIICKSDLHSRPTLHDNILVWHLYKNAYVQAFCTDGDATIDIVGNSVFTGSIIHWHPDEADMLQELYTLGKKGNILVLKKTLLSTYVLYSGNAAQCPIPAKRRWDMGKKRFDSGTLIYLEQMT